MERVEQAVILAGGLGTRLRPFTEGSPKHLYPVGGRPFIDYLLYQMRDWGITRVLLLLGYKAEQIVAHVQQHPVEGLSVEFDTMPPEYDTAGRLAHARPLLDSAFLLSYCDNYCPVNYAAHAAAFLSGNELVRLCTYANADGYTKSNLRVESDGKVLVYDKLRRTAGLAGVDIGYALIRREALDLLPASTADVNFEAAVYPRALELGRLYATMTEHRYYSVGGWERMPLTELFFTNPPTAFLDRDGTLNVRPPKACYVETPEQFIWLPRAREAVAALKQRGWRVILVSNQPGIARGNFDVTTLDAIHAKMQAELRQVGGEIDAIYYCPHGWDDGCTCRKPAPGMLYMAQKDFCLDLTKCVLIGDDERDIIAGEAAGCHCMRVDESYSLADAVANLLKGHDA